MNWKTGVAAVALGVAVVFATAPLATRAFAGSKTVLKSVDTDNDGTIDLDEARVAANALFDQLDRDHEGTLDRRNCVAICRPRSWPRPIPITTGP